MLPRFRTQTTLPEKPKALPQNSRILSNRITKYLRKDSQSPPPKTPRKQPSELPTPPQPPPQKEPNTLKSPNNNHQYFFPHKNAF